MWKRAIGLLILAATGAACSRSTGLAAGIESPATSPTGLSAPCDVGLAATAVTVSFVPTFSTTQEEASITITGHDSSLVQVLRSESSAPETDGSVTIDAEAASNGTWTASFYVQVDSAFAGPTRTLEITIDLSSEEKTPVSATIELPVTTGCLTAEVTPTALDFLCDPVDGWLAATVSCTATLGGTGSWGTAPSMRLVNAGTTVRVVRDGTPYTDTAPLTATGATFTVEVNPTAGTVPDTLELEFRPDGSTDAQATASITLDVDCSTCSPDTVGPLLFEWQPDVLSVEKKLAISDGTALVEWTILDSWLTSSGNTRPGSPDISPDGKYLAFTVASGAVYVLDLTAPSGTEPIRLTPVGYSYRDLAWSNTQFKLPDAPEDDDPTYVLACGRRDTPGVFALKITMLAVPPDPADITQRAGYVLTSPGTGDDHASPTWSPDDSRIAYQNLNVSDRSLYSIATDDSEGSPTLELDAGDLPTSLFPGVNYPRWHPTEDRYIAFHHAGAVYVFDRIDESFQARTLTSPERYSAAWTANGGGLVYLRGQASLVLLCDEATESALFDFPGTTPSSASFIRIPRTPEAIDVLNAALGK